MSGPFVLVIDDDPTLRDSVSAVLELHGYLVRQASSGSEAIELLSRSSQLPSAILLDLIMPGMSGDEVLEVLTRDPRLAMIPVIMISATRQRPPKGADMMLPKPFSALALLHAVKQSCDACD
jgi:CheY-like chemotaxis protein